MTGSKAPSVADVETRPVILVVDDNQLNRDALNRRLQPARFRVQHLGDLQRDEYRIIEAVDGEQALACLRAQTVDLVLLDIMMPVLDGAATLKAMKADAALRDIPVIMVTAVDNVKTAAECISLGADDFVTKPFNPALLRARVTSCLRRRFRHREEQLLSRKHLKNVRELEQVVAQQAEDLDTAQTAIVFAISRLAESRDPETGTHLERLREYCRVLAERLVQAKDIKDECPICRKEMGTGKKFNHCQTFIPFK